MTNQEILETYGKYTPEQLKEMQKDILNLHKKGEATVAHITAFYEISHIINKIESIMRGKLEQ